MYQVCLSATFAVYKIIQAFSYKIRDKFEFTGSPFSSFRPNNYILNIYTIIAK
jgi:hypothetical protein